MCCSQTLSNLTFLRVGETKYHNYTKQKVEQNFNFLHLPASGSVLYKLPVSQYLAYGLRGN